MTFTLHVPQIIWLVLVIYGTAYALVNHGKPRPPYNIWIDLVSTAISLGLLWWGGFFGGVR